ncbi:MAG TPA: hypothetical protein PLT75_12385 [Spirochaetota bacterium]|mgnify:FL=1|nr:hypothetical protein [Spirochaetota bacterium]
MNNITESQKNRKHGVVSRVLKILSGMMLLCAAGYCVFLFVLPLRCAPSNSDLAQAIVSGDPFKVNSVVMSSRESFSESYRVEGKSLRQLAEETCNKEIVDLVDYALNKELVDILLGK